MLPLLLAIAVASAQETPPRQQVIRFGISVVALGDLDGDGAGEFAVGGQKDNGLGIVRIHSGRKGTQLLEVVGQSWLGWHMAGLGDIDGDGAGDFASDDGLSRIVAHSGRTGQRLFDLRLETLDPTLAVTWMGGPTDGGRDFDGDGAGDLLVSAQYATNEAQPEHSRYGVLVVSGKSGAILQSIRANDFGFWSCFAGDLDTDGLEDLVLLSPHPSPRSDQVRAYAFSRSREEFLWKCTLPGQYPEVRVRGRLLGDVNSDSTSDVAVSVVCDSSGHPKPHQDGRPPGSAWILSGKDGAVLHEVKSPAEKVSSPWNLFGFDLSPTGDLDEDGHPDLLVTSYEDLFRDLHQRGAVHVVSGSTGRIVRTIKEPPSPGNGRASYEDFGASVASIGNVNDDSFPDFVVGAMHDFEGARYPGVVHVLSGTDGRALYVLP